MSVGPLGGLVGGVAATPVAQSTGSEVERLQQAQGNQERQVRNEQRAEDAGGIGQTDGDDHETAERDADGRRPWEASRRRREGLEAGPLDHRLSKDASRQSGNLLDLTG